MYRSKTSIAAAVGTIAMLTASVATAGSHEFDPNSFNAKEINGRSSYIGVSYTDASLSDVSWMEKQPIAGTIMRRRHGNSVGFADADGILVTLGSDFGYVRIESEFGYQETDINKILKGLNPSGKIDIGTAMVNMAFEYSVDPGELAGSGSSGFSLTPYVQAGGGVFGVLGNIQYTQPGVVARNEALDHGMFMAPAIQGAAGLTVGLPMGLEVFAQYSEKLVYTYNYRDSDDIHIKTVSGGLRLNF